MKRLLPLILALLLLTACAAEAAPEGSAEPTPVPTQESTPPEQTVHDLPRYYTEPRPVPEELDFPDDGFEVEEYYLAEPFGICGRALLLRGRNAAGRERFKCRYFSYVPEGGEYVLRGASADEGSGAYIQEQSGALLAFVPCLAEGVTGPEVFYPVDRETALRAWRDMPFFDEIELPLDRRMIEARLEALPDVNKLDEHEYEYEGVRISCREFSTRNAAYIYSFLLREPRRSAFRARPEHRREHAFRGAGALPLPAGGLYARPHGRPALRHLGRRTLRRAPHERPGQPLPAISGRRELPVPQL